MAKKGKSGVVSVTNHIAGSSGKGPFKFSEMPGSKCMSKAHPGFDTSSPARMNSRHAVTRGRSDKNNMNQGGTNQKIGHGRASFGCSSYRTAGKGGKSHD